MKGVQYIIAATLSENAPLENQYQNLNRTTIDHYSYKYILILDDIGIWLKKNRDGFWRITGMFIFDSLSLF